MGHILSQLSKEPELAQSHITSRSVTLFPTAQLGSDKHAKPQHPKTTGETTGIFLNPQTVQFLVLSSAMVNMSNSDSVAAFG